MSSSERENVIQSACMSALAAYFYSLGITYHQLWTYSNQQGSDPNKFCGDLVGIIEDATLLLLEVKALDHATKELSAFDDDQYEEAKSMERAGLPIVYCYDNKNQLTYNERPQPKNWPTITLNELNVSKPSLLDSKVPKIAQHCTLYDLIKQGMQTQQQSPLEKLAKVVGHFLPDQMRNGLVTVLFSEKRKEAYELPGNQLEMFFNWLVKNPGSKHPAIDDRINRLRAAATSERAKSTLPAKGKPDGGNRMKRKN